MRAKQERSTEPRAVRFARRLRTVGGLAALIALACGQEPARPGEALRNLIVAEPPQELIAWTDLLARRVMETWSARALPQDSGWAATAGDARQAGLCLGASAGVLVLSGPFLERLSDARQLEIEATGVRRTTLELSWQGRDGAWSEAEFRKWGDAPDPRHELFRFELSDEARAATVLRLSMVAEPDRDLCLVRLAWLSQEFDPDRLAVLSARPWRLDLDGEVRDAVIASPDSAVAFQLPARSRGHFELGYGLWGDGPAAFAFELEVSEGGEWRSVWGAAASSEEGPGWRDVRLDLPEARSTRAARLIVRSLGGGDMHAVPVWSHLRWRPDAPPESRRPNVILVSIDTLRPDRMSVYGSERATTPALAAWARRRAVVFEQAVAAAPWTLPSHVSMLTGLDVLHHGVVDALPAPPEIEFIQEVLAGAGYRTLAVTGSGYLDPRYGFHQGFQRYRHWPEKWLAGGELEHGTEWASRFLREESDQPFFLFFHTYEVHGPYRARQPYFSDYCDGPTDLVVAPEPEGKRAPGAREVSHRFVMFPPGQRQLRQPIPAQLATMPTDLYDSGVANVDAHLSVLLELLRTSGLEASTLVVITSDHGEALGEHHLAGHGFLYDDNLLVPLMIAFPGSERGGERVAAQVRSIDIVPTILDVVGLRPAAQMDGRSLRPLALGETTRFEREALSYSGALGVSLRVGARAKLLLYDAVVERRSELDRYFRVDEDPMELKDRVGELADRAAWTSRILERVNGAGSGLRLSLGGLALGERVGLRAPWLGPGQVKWAGAPSDGVVWGMEEILTLEGRGPQSLEFLARLEAPPAAALEVWLRGERNELALPHQGLAPGQRYRVSLSSGRLVPASEAGEEETPRLEIWLQGEATDSGQDPARADAALREQLRALGYLQ